MSARDLARGGARGGASGCSQQAVQGSLQVVVVVHQSHPSILLIKAHLHDVLQCLLIHLAEMKGDLTFNDKKYYSTISDQISERGEGEQRKNERKKEGDRRGRREKDIK